MAYLQRPAHERRVVAAFGSREQARAALVALERHGIEAGDMALLDHEEAMPVAGASRDRDVEVTRDVGRRYATWGVVGAVAGAVLVAVVINVVGVEPRVPSTLGAAVAGAIAGFYLGGFWGAAKDLPVNETALDTYAPGGERSQEVHLAVFVSDTAAADEVSGLLRGLHARDVRTAAPGDD